MYIWILKALALLAIQTNGVTFRPFLHGMEVGGEPVFQRLDEGFFAGFEWQCRAGGGVFRLNMDETCYAGLENHGGTFELVTGP